MEWTRLLPEAEKPEFASDVLERYQVAAVDKADEGKVFKFYQMDISLVRGDQPKVA